MSRAFWFFASAVSVTMLLGSSPAIPLQREQAATSLRLEPFGTGLPQRGQWRSAFAVADMNGDAVLDLVHGPPRKGRGWPVIFIGDGKGGFARWAAASFPGLPFDYGVVAVADFDGDGHACDIAIGSHLRGLTVLVGNRTGEFREWARGLEFRVPRPGDEVPFTPGALVAVDWDKDGRTDLAAVSEGPARLALRAGESPSGGIRVFMNRPEGWQPGVLAPTDGSLIGRSLAAGDVNADGRPDLLTGSATRGFTRILKWNNMGRAGPAALVPLPVAAKAFVTAVTLVDVDRNGRSDPIIACSIPNGSGWRHTLQVHLSFPGRFETIEALPAALASPLRAIAAGDLDADGELDLAAVSDDGTLCVFRGEQTGRVTLALTEPAPQWRAGCAGYDVHLGDFDGDGRDEIVASFAGEPAGFGGKLVSNTGGGIQAWKVKTSTGPAKAE